jgi:hypothetical protein
MRLRRDLYCECDSRSVTPLFYNLLFLMSLTSNTKFLAQDGIDGTLSVPLGRENIQPVRPVSDVPLNLQTPSVVATAEANSPATAMLIFTVVSALIWFKFK